MEAGRKPRIYFDTTIPNYLFADDSPDRMEWTWRLWTNCVAGKYDIFVSDVFFEEMQKCPQAKLGKMNEQLGLIKSEQLEESDEVMKLALEYIQQGVLTERSLNDCLHIAYAVTSSCDLIFSWNFDDLVNDRTRGRVKVVNAISLYKEILIVSPDEFLQGAYK
jgi:predicted nucleic acid-binding protein